MVIFEQNWLYSFNSGCFLAKVVVFLKSGCIPEKVVVIEQSG